MTTTPHEQHPLDHLDTVDLALLRALRSDGRMPNVRLAAIAGIAPSTCSMRVRALVDRGVISGFEARIDPASLGWTLQALVSVSIRSGARQRITEFSREIRALPEVIQFFFLGGSEDFIVHVAARDSDHVRDFVLEALSANPVVASTRTSLVFDHVHQGATIASGTEKLV